MEIDLVNAAATTWVHYLPIATTVLAAIFAIVLLRRYASRGGTHHLWWAIGVITYGVGTAFESAITLGGNTVFLNKGWYIAGALLGGYPLAQGSVYLHLRRRMAHVLTAVTVPFIVAVSVLVAFSPVVWEALEVHRPSGAILGWQWLRLTTPFINLYAVVFLIGGAILSSARYARGRTASDRSRAQGNAAIAFGAILPGIGGSMAKAGVVEALYVGELIGLLFIWLGFYLCVREPRQWADAVAAPAGARAA
jgi:hypothetical protein